MAEYIVSAWAGEPPASLAEAEATAARLHAQPHAADTRIADFIERLLARYPSADMLPQDEQETTVWSDGEPLRGALPGPICTLGIELDELPAVHAFVLATARACGLIVHDSEARRAYLPDATMLTADGRVATPPPPPAPSATPLEALEPAPQCRDGRYRLYLMFKPQFSAKECSQHFQWALLQGDPLDYVARLRAKEFNGMGRRELSLHDIDFDRFHRFARNVNSRIAQAGGPLPWTDDAPLDDTQPRLSYAIYVKPERVREMRAMVFEEASCQDLHVWDPQAQLIVHPRGTWMHDTREGGVTDTGKYHYGYARAYQQLKAGLKGPMKALGFDTEKVPYNDYLLFVRKAPGVRQCLEINPTGSQDAEVQTEVRLEVDKASLPKPAPRWPLTQDGEDQDIILRRPLMAFVAPGSFEMLVYRRDRVELHRDRHAALLRDWILATFRERALPLLDPLSSLAAVDERLNGDGLPPFDGEDPLTDRYRLLVAHLANAGRFEVTVARIEARLDRWVAEVPERPLVLRENAYRLWSVDDSRKWLVAVQALRTNAA